MMDVPVEQINIFVFCKVLMIGPISILFFAVFSSYRAHMNPLLDTAFIGLIFQYKYRDTLKCAVNITLKKLIESEDIFLFFQYST